MATFEQQIAAFAKRANQSVDRTMRGVSIKLFSNVIYASPVDTGRFRANWVAALSTPSKEVSLSEDKRGTKAVSNMVSVVNGAPVAFEFTLSNNLPYANTIEFGGYPGDGPNTIGGFSKQAPHGVVRVNVARFQQILDEQARINRV
jgi:hypothetical protein